MPRYIALVFLLLLLLPWSVLSATDEPSFSAKVSAYDPPAGTELDAYDKLYLQVSYESNLQVRFQIVPYLNGQELEYGVMSSSTSVWPAGQHDALAWVSFSTETHIDEVRIIALDLRWHKIGQFGVTLDALWNATPVQQPREPAEWVRKLIRKNRLRQELAFDPNPQKEEVVYDAFFYASVILIPLYLLMQIRFLKVWRGRWRELAAIPIISVTPLLVMAILGLGIELRLWIIFIFRGMPLALLYLVALWLAKWLNEKKNVSDS